MRLPLFIVSCLLGLSATTVTAIESISLPPSTPTGIVCIQVVCPDPGAEPTCPSDCKTSCIFQTDDPCCPNQKVAVCQDDSSSSSSSSNPVITGTPTESPSSTSSSNTPAPTLSSPAVSSSISSSSSIPSSNSSSASAPSQSPSTGNNESDSNRIVVATTLLMNALLVSVFGTLQ